MTDLPIPADGPDAVAAPAAPLPPTVRAYVDGRPVDVPRGAAVRAVVQAFDPAAAARLDGDGRTVTDSRGLPVDVDAPAYAGAIYRLSGGLRAAAPPASAPAPAADPTA